MAEKLIPVKTGVLTERGPSGKNIPLLGPSGEQISFKKLVLNEGQLHRQVGKGETLEQYGQRIELLMEEIDAFYPDNAREGVHSAEGATAYGFDLWGRAMATPKTVSTLEANRFHCLAYLMRQSSDSPLQKRWAVAGLSGGKRAADKELDRIVSEIGVTIPGVVVSVG
jgi:hypothetical protein